MTVLKCEGTVVSNTDSNVEKSPAAVYAATESLLEECYAEAEDLSERHDYAPYESILGSETLVKVRRVAATRHAGRGILLTLSAYKVVRPDQDIRRYKARATLGGFSARGIDEAVTVPFLKRHSLRYSVQSHWMTRTFAAKEMFGQGPPLKTTPPHVGLLMEEIIVSLQSVRSPGAARSVVVLILAELINERNQGHIALTRPKGLSIDHVLALLKSHFERRFKSNAPRLPQLAIYAIYQCMMSSVKRYQDLELRKIERMKSADRKSGSVGDIQVNRDGTPVEAVEVKFGIPISYDIVSEAIEKIRSASVERYLILSTSGVDERDRESIDSVREDFLRSNGCEIIPNGVYESLRYYLRLLRSTNEFVNEYVDLLTADTDLDYEHRLAWNEVCAGLT